MTFEPYKVMKYHVYLLQLENYELGRFWKLLLARGWFAGTSQRKDLVWTKKATLLFVLNQVLILFFAVFLFRRNYFVNFYFGWVKFFLFFISVYILDFFTPVFLSVANILFWPFDRVAKKGVTNKAKHKINSLSNLKIIGIAGSYGKTTMKEVLGAVLSAQYAVVSTPDSVNTPVGIGRWILNKVDESTQILIVEMGEHYRGDIKEICAITKPDISVVMGVNEAHLERMKTLDSVTATIFEIVSESKPHSLVMLNGDDAKVVEHYKEFVWPDHKVDKFSISNFKFSRFNPEKLVWEAEAKDFGKFDINLLGEYALGLVDAAIRIAQSLGMSAENIKAGINKIKPVEHRLQPVKGAGDVLIIDDAYNGNPSGVSEAIKVLSRFPNRRKIYITPGLVEMGKATAQVHRTIGKQLAGVADVVILIKNSVTPFVAEGLQEVRGKRQVETIWFDTAQEAHASLAKILKQGDVVLFQNDWGDNYL